MSFGRGAERDVERGFPHLAEVRSALTTLYRELSPDRVRGFGVSVLPVDVAFDDDEDLTAGVRRIAGVMVRHLGLPDVPVEVRFREMAEAAWVEPSDGGAYTVELNQRFDAHRRDIGAVLAHEVTHVFLHRAGLSLTDTGADEILTDTAAAYLGCGWLLLDAFRQDALTSQKLGYLTPEEYGYVLAKRSLAIGEDPRVWFTSPQAYDAYGKGLRRAEHDAAQPPLVTAGWAARRGYEAQRGLARSGRATPGVGAYRFEADRDGAGQRVVFDCPVCAGRLRLPVRGPVRARCGVCRTVLECDT
ncbi:MULTISPECIES: hypothetical protein [Streptomyces]|uniref:hypothetical protein n=2 Tax=Streptomyces TaxID=1883 RepID=UPI000CD55814|nr:MULTISPECIES: hypothetical protein [Streptomyces]